MSKKPDQGGDTDPLYQFFAFQDLYPGLVNLAFDISIGCVIVVNVILFKGTSRAFRIEA